MPILANSLNNPVGGWCDALCPPFLSSLQTGTRHSCNARELFESPGPFWLLMNCLESLGQMVVRKCQQNSSLQRPRGDRGAPNEVTQVFGEPIHDCLPTVFQVEGFGEQQLNGRC